MQDPNLRIVGNSHHSLQLRNFRNCRHIFVKATFLKLVNRKSSRFPTHSLTRFKRIKQKNIPSNKLFHFEIAK